MQNCNKIGYFKINYSSTSYIIKKSPIGVR